MRDIKSCLSKLPYLCCTKVVSRFNLTISQNQTSHIHSKTSRNVRKSLCCTNKFICLNTVCSHLLCIGIELHDRERRFQRKLLNFRKDLVCLFFVLYDRAKSNLLQLELSAHIYHVFYPLVELLHGEHQSKLHSKVLESRHYAVGLFFDTTHSSPYLVYALCNLLVCVCRSLPFWGVRLCGSQRFFEVFLSSNKPVKSIGSSSKIYSTSKRCVFIVVCSTPHFCLSLILLLTLAFLFLLDCCFTSLCLLLLRCNPLFNGNLGFSKS